LAQYAILIARPILILDNKVIVARTPEKLNDFISGFSRIDLTNHCECRRKPKGIFAVKS
jgi:hypothetical protein